LPNETAGLVSAIVTTKNSAATLEACLRSLRGQTYTRLELIVIDNNSSDATLEIAERYADRVATIGPERSAQRNLGARLAGGGHLLFIDSDMVLDADVVSDGVSLLQQTRMPAAVIPEETVGEGFWTRCRTLERSCYTGDDTMEAARLYTRDAFEAAGGFDVNLTAPEDWDLSRRVAQRQHLPRTHAMILHDEGRIRLGQLYRKKRYYATGYLRFLRRYRGGALAQANPILRTAYARHWRRLARHPLLTAGMFTMKALELTAVVHGATEGAVRGVDSRRRGVYEARPAAPPIARPLLVTFGSVRVPDGGIQVRSRTLAEHLSGMGLAPAIVSTRETGSDAAVPSWARSVRVPARKPRWGLSLQFARLIRVAAADADLIILANAMFMPALALARVRLPLVWDTNECQSLHYQRLRRTPANRAKLLIWMGLERWAARRCQLAVAIGDVEASEWRKIHPGLRGKMVTVDHAAWATPRDDTRAGAELERLLGRKPGGPVLVFVGRLAAKQNATAARWIVDTLAPSLPRDVTVALCGAGTERLRGRGTGARVAPLGSVDDVDSVIAAADLCLAPLAAGAGVKTKVLHYLAHGRRVAGTPVAFEGLDGAPGLYCAPLEEQPALVARLLSVAEPADVAEQRAAAQRAWIDERHGGAQIGRQWRDALQCLSRR